MPRTIVLDPMLRAIADIPWDFPQGHAATVRDLLRNLPAIDASAGVPDECTDADRATRPKF
jgi:hypothetical protein